MGLRMLLMLLLLLLLMLLLLLAPRVALLKAGLRVQVMAGRQR